MEIIVKCPVCKTQCTDVHGKLTPKVKISTVRIIEELQSKYRAERCPRCLQMVCRSTKEPEWPKSSV